MRGFVSFSSFLALILVLVHTSFSESQPRVTLKLGKVKGTSELFDGETVNVYLGLPYAQSPVKDLRFKKPLPLTEPWNRELDATKWPNICQQSSPFLAMFGFVHQNFSEDCLYLNIWSPEEGEELKPVMFWIHGGAYSMGSASQEGYNALPLAAKGDVVVVAINYRLGALGFLFGGTSDTPGNVGLFDQALALEWVQDNIRYFGGDPERVTIFGESAGGMSVGQHILSPVSRNLFKKAIPMSGSASCPSFSDTKANGLIKANNLAQLLKCPGVEDKGHLSKEQIKCLREADAEKITQLQGLSQITDGLKKHKLLNIEFVPIHGDEFMPRAPREMLEEKDFKRNASILLGVVNDEGAILELGLKLDPKYRNLIVKGNITEWKALLTDILAKADIPDSNISPIVDFYYANANSVTSYRKALSHALGDYILTCPTLLAAAKLASVMSNKVNAYHITYKSSVTLGTLAGYCTEDDEVCHALELHLLFGSPFLEPQKYGEHDIKASFEMITIWTDFAKNDKLFWPQYMTTKSGEIIPSNYEINPTKDRRLFNQYKHYACKLWEPFMA